MLICATVCLYVCLIVSGPKLVPENLPYDWPVDGTSCVSIQCVLVLSPRWLPIDGSSWLSYCIDDLVSFAGQRAPPSSGQFTNSERLANRPCGSKALRLPCGL